MFFVIERTNITSWLLPFSLHSEELYARIISQRRIFLRRESGILMRSLLAPIGESCPLPAHKSARVCRIHNFLTFIAFSFSLSHIHARTHTHVSFVNSSYSIGRFDKKERFERVPRVHKRCSLFAFSIGQFYISFFFLIVQKASVASPNYVSLSLLAISFTRDPYLISTFDNRN